jgi:hypothetical protein
MKTILFLALITSIFTSGTYAQSDTVTTQSGLKYIILEKGDGPHAENGKSVDVNYTGYFINGKKFDSSKDRNEPFDFILGTGKVIKGWDEGVALMSVGDKYRFIIPPDLAYGKKGAGGVIPPNSTLIFDVELLNVSEPKISIADTLMMIIFNSGIDTAVQKYREFKKDSPDKFNFKESELNTLGYQLLQGGRIKDAIEIFKLNVEQFPDSWNAYDSMGEAYADDGQKELAIKNYEKSLELNPDNKNGAEVLKKLKEEK